MCSKPHHRACGRKGPRRVAELCAGHGWREAQHKVREAATRIADPGGGVTGPKGFVPRSAVSLPRRVRIPDARRGRPGPTIHARAKVCRRAIHRGLVRRCLGAVGLRCGCRLAFWGGGGGAAPSYLQAKCSTQLQQAWMVSRKKRGGVGIMEGNDDNGCHAWPLQNSGGCQGAPSCEQNDLHNPLLLIINYLLLLSAGPLPVARRVEGEGVSCCGISVANIQPNVKVLRARYKNYQTSACSKNQALQEIS